MQEKIEELNQLSKLAQYWILQSTTRAGSGHPTSSLSAVELMIGLMFGGYFRYKLDNPRYINNDRLIFSKGHASPLFYTLWALAGFVTKEELMELRQFSSNLEGHPTMNFPYTECATGSLGQGLSVGVGIALNAKYLDKLDYKTYVLLGDSEMAEGSVWEAMDSAVYNKLDNLVAIVDINRLGQRGETMFGHNLDVYKKKAEAFGWEVFLVEDGHSIEQILDVYNKLESQTRPTMILARTFKGHPISFLQDKEGFHGKALSEEELHTALLELGNVDISMRGTVTHPLVKDLSHTKPEIEDSLYPRYDIGQNVSPRVVYGEALKILATAYTDLIVLDAEVSNSTYANQIQTIDKNRFFEMFIAEQNMGGVAVGLSRMRKKVFVSTFAAFFTRAFDQIRMSQYSESNITFVGTHCGVSIGQDGASQMGLEDIAMFRTLLDSVIIYPSDAVSTLKLTEQLYLHKGLSYLRITRGEMPVIYPEEETFVIGGSKVLRKSTMDKITLIGAGITLHEILKAHNALKEKNINTRVIDLYSVKPIDVATLHEAGRETHFLITVEDHSMAGGLGEAVRSAMEHTEAKVYSMSVDKMPRSGTKEELLEYENINSNAIIKKVQDLINQ